MCAANVFSQVGAAGELQLAVIPAARVAQRLAPRRRRAAPRRRSPAVTVEHGRCGAPAGGRALHVHQGAADTGEKTEKNTFTFLFCYHYVWWYERFHLTICSVEIKSSRWAAGGVCKLSQMLTHPTRGQTLLSAHTHTASSCPPALCGNSSSSEVVQLPQQQDHISCQTDFRADSSLCELLSLLTELCAVCVCLS